MNDPFLPFARWLEWLDSHDGRLARRKGGGKENEFDLVCCIPQPGHGGQMIYTIGDLRKLVGAGEELKRLKQL